MHGVGFGACVTVYFGAVVGWGTGGVEGGVLPAW